MNADACIGFRTDGSQHAEVDAYARANGLTATFAPWHPNPEYRLFEAGSLLSRNDEYPSGLVIVDERGNPKPWKQ